MPEDLNAIATNSAADISGDPVVQTEVDLMCILADFPELGAEISANITEDMISDSRVGSLIKNHLKGNIPLTHAVIEETLGDPIYQVKRSFFKISDLDRIISALYTHYKMKYFTQKLPNKLLHCDSISKAAGELEKANQIAAKGLTKTAAYSHKTYYDEFLAYMKTSQESYKTGLPVIDNRLTGGMMMSNFIVVAADTGVGKTLFVTQIIENIVATYNVPACFFCLEMPRAHMLSRRVALIADGISSKSITEKKVEDDKWLLLSRAASDMAERPICIIDDAHSFGDICIHIRNLAAKGFKFFVVDYVQLIRMPGSSVNEKQLLDEVTIRFKLMANTYNICIIAISQFHRKDDMKMTAKNGVIKREPELSDMKGSSALEQNADRVMLLWCPPEEMMCGDLKEKRLLKFILKKDRHGDSFSCWLSHTKSNGRIEQATEDQVKAFMQSKQAETQSPYITNFKKPKEANDAYNRL